MATTYKPTFDTEVRTVTTIERRDTMHTEAIDWENYPFDAPEHTQHMCCNDDEKKRRIEKLKEYLRICERYESEDVRATNGNILQKVVGVGMASSWPYWKPRPTVLVSGTLGIEWLDWASLNGAEIRKPSAS